MFKVNWQTNKQTNNVCGHQYPKLVMKLYNTDNILNDSNLSSNHTCSTAECVTKSETYIWRNNCGHNMWSHSNAAANSGVFWDIMMLCHWAYSCQLCQEVFFHFYNLNMKSLQYFKMSETACPMMRHIPGDLTL